MPTLFRCIVFVLVFELFHYPTEASPSVEVNRVALAYNRGYDICREITAWSGPESKKSADEECERAFRALDGLGLNTCSGYRNAECRLVPGDEYQLYQCTCLISYCDSTSVKSHIITPFRDCATVIRNKERDTGQIPSPTPNFQQRRSQYDDALQAAQTLRVSTSYGRYGETGNSNGVYNGNPGTSNPSNSSGALSRLTVHYPIGRRPGSQPRPYACDECDGLFRSARNLFDHKRFKHTVNDTHCYLCNNTYISGKAFMFHLEKTHPEIAKAEKATVYFSAEREAVLPYSCKFCLKRFTTQMTLSNHMRSHTTDDTTCPECGKVMANRGSLKGHMRTHHPGVPIPKAAPPIRAPGTGNFSCGECGKKYACINSLVRHEKSHTTLETYCMVCDEIMGTKHSYRRHLKRKHPEFAKTENDVERQEYEKRNPIACEKCEKRFKNDRGFREHLDVHDGKTKCDECDAVFAWKSSLAKHKKKEHKTK